MIVRVEVDQELAVHLTVRTDDEARRLFKEYADENGLVIVTPMEHRAVFVVSEPTGERHLYWVYAVHKAKLEGLV